MRKGADVVFQCVLPIAVDSFVLRANMADFLIPLMEAEKWALFYCGLTKLIKPAQIKSRQSVVSWSPG